jgi:hypothetical protein
MSSNKQQFCTEKNAENMHLIVLTLQFLELLHKEITIKFTNK